MIGFLVKSFVTVCVWLPLKVMAGALSLLGPAIQWSVWLFLLPLKVLVLPFKILF